MRSQKSKGAVCAALLLLGAALVWFGDRLLAARGEHWTGYAAIFAGLPLAVASLILLIKALVLARGEAKLLAGNGVIGRWHLSAAEWDRFRAYDPIRAAQHPSLANDLAIRKETPAQGVDVIVGKTSLLIDGAYHVLRPGGLPELRGIAWLSDPVDPECLELALAHPTNKYGGKLLRALRIPIARVARAEARRVFDHYAVITRPRASPAERNPGRVIRSSLAVSILCAGVAGVGFAMNAQGITGDMPIILAVGGSVAGLGAALLALLVALLHRRPRSRG